MNFFETANLPDILTYDEFKQTTLVREMLGKAEPQAKAARKTFIETASPEKRQALERALDTQVLNADFAVTLANGSQVTIADLIENIDMFIGQMIPDPLEPSYRNGALCAHINRFGIYSHAHGGQNYRFRSLAAAQDKTLDALIKLGPAFLSTDSGIERLRQEDPDVVKRLLGEWRAADFHSQYNKVHEALFPRFGFPPYQHVNPDEIPPRDWLGKPWALRGFVIALGSHGGLGKSNLMILVALSMATGRDLIGFEPRGKFRVAIFQGEDPMEEMQRRFEAICLHYEIKPEDYGDRISIVTGREMPMEIVSLDERGRAAVPKDADAVIKALKAARIDLLIVDPFVACHSVPEGANEFIEKVIKTMNRIADEAKCAILIGHHLVKSKERAGGMDLRGGGALFNGLRGLMLLNPMTKAQAVEAGIDESEIWKYTNLIDTKFNMYGPGKEIWFYAQGVPIGRDDGYGQEVIGVPTRHEMQGGIWR